MHTVLTDALGAFLMVNNRPERDFSLIYTRPHFVLILMILRALGFACGQKPKTMVSRVLFIHGHFEMPESVQNAWWSGI